MILANGSNGHCGPATGESSWQVIVLKLDRCSIIRQPTTQPDMRKRFPVRREESVYNIRLAFVMDGVSFDFEVRDFMNFTSDVERKQLPFAISRALNDTVAGGRKAAQGQMEGDLHRPTAYAKRGIVYERSDKHNLEASVIIYGSKSTNGGLPAAYFLGPQIDGGQRSHKAFEKQLVARGYMRTNEVAVPAARLRLNQYGNVTQGQINKIMSGLKVDYRGGGATRVASTSKGKSRAAAKGRYFVPRRSSSLAPGIYYEKPSRKKAIYPVMLFVGKTAYTKRFKFRQAVILHANRNFEKNFNIRFQQALATAR